MKQFIQGIDSNDMSNIGKEYNYGHFVGTIGITYPDDLYSIKPFKQGYADGLCIYRENKLLRLIQGK